MRKGLIIFIVVVLAAGSLAGVVFYRKNTQKDSQLSDQFKQIEALKKKISKLDQDAAGFHQQSAADQKRIKSLEDEKQHVVQLEKVLKENDEALKAARKKYDGLRDDFEKSGKIRKSLEEQIAKLIDQQSKDQDKYSSLDKKLLHTNQLLTDAEKDIQSIKSIKDDLVNELEKERKTGRILKKQLAEAHDSNLSEQIEVQNKQKELETTQAQVAVLKEEVQKNKTVQAILEKEVSGFKTQLLDLKETHLKIQSLQKEIQKTADINSLLKNQISILQLQLNNYQEKTLNYASTVEEKESLLKQIVSNLNNCLVNSKDVEASLQTAQFQVINLKGMVEQARAEQIVMGKQLSNLESEKAEMALKLTEVKKTYDTLIRELHDKIETKEAVLEDCDKKFSVTFVDRVLFYSGKASITTAGQGVLKKTGDILSKMRSGVIRIAGHTDNVPIRRGWRGRFPTNWELSSARAAAVARFFQKESNISPEKMEVVGFGSHRPIASNTTREGRAKNRRVEITIAPMGPKARSTP